MYDLLKIDQKYTLGLTDISQSRLITEDDGGGPGPPSSERQFVVRETAIAAKYHGALDDVRGGQGCSVLVNKLRRLKPPPPKVLEHYHKEALAGYPEIFGSGRETHRVRAL